MFLGSAIAVNADTSEAITFTTYYPSPYGSYDQLQANRMAVGNGVGQPSVDGELQVARSVIFTPQLSAGGLTTPKKGEVIYNNSVAAGNPFNYYDGSSLQLFGGGGGTSFTYYCFSSSYGTPQCVNAGGAQGYCPTGYNQVRALGTWGFCGNSVDETYFFLPAGTLISCYPGYGLTAGNGYVCSQ